MRLEADIEETGVRVCDAIAEAVEHYASVSGIADDFPEHFLPAFVLTTLGSVLTVAMEINSSKLWNWNSRMRARRSGSLTNEPFPAQPSDFVPRVGGWKPDLVLFQGDHSKKHETDFLCLVEFKTWKDIKDDVIKLKNLLTFLDMCPWGMACGLTDRLDWIEIVKERTQQDGDRFVKGRVARPLGEPQKNFYAYGSIIENPRYKALHT